MSKKQSHQVYAAVYKDKFQAVCAARALFAEVYELLIKQGLNVELRPFANEQFEIPQIHMLDGVELHNGGFQPIICFDVVTFHKSFSNSGPHFRLEVRFEPPYAMRQMRGFGHMVTVLRNPERTPKLMDPNSICDFILLYTDGIRKRQAAIDKQSAENILKRARRDLNEDIAKQLRERPNKGRAHVFAGQNPSHGEPEVWLQLRGTPEEIAAACALLDPVFPLPQTKTSRE